MSPRPPIRPWAAEDVPAPTGSEAVAFDRASIDELGIPQPVLMENAGRSLATVVARLYAGRRVVGMVGAGNNGGDALVALRTLHAWGYDVCAVLVADRPAEDPLLHGWAPDVRSDREIASREAWAEVLPADAVVLDGILGTGAKGAPRARQAEVIRRLAEHDGPIVAVDLPSGVDADTGSVPGAAVRADLTVAFGAPKLGCLVHPARALVGRHVAVEIGFPPASTSRFAARVATPLWAQARLPPRGTDTHKNAVGRLAVVAGRPGMAGAAVLAARAAFRAGVGVVRVCSAPENREVIQSAVPEAIFVDTSDEGALREALDQADAVAVGPGLGTDGAAVAAVRNVAAGAPVPMVVDADALNLVARSSWSLDPARPVLITPHRGEMTRLLGAPTDDPVPQDPASLARLAAARFGCTVLLKGSPSVVASPDGALIIDTQGSSDLAVAGMGDALTGVCGGLMAQGLSPSVAGGVGLYLSGRSARIAAKGAALTPSDVVRRLPTALVERGAGPNALDLPYVVFDADPAR